MVQGEIPLQVKDGKSTCFFEASAFGVRVTGIEPAGGPVALRLPRLTADRNDRRPPVLLQAKEKHLPFKASAFLVRVTGLEPAAS